MKLYFEDSNENRRFLAECKDETEVNQKIKEFINNCNKRKPKSQQFKMYYVRTWNEDNKTWYDVGSHSEFFYTEK